MSETKNYVHENPDVTESLGDGSITLTYRWETPEKKHIFLHLSYSLKQSPDKGSYLLCRSNLDSSQVKGQGSALWEYLTQKIQETARKGIKDTGPIAVLHVASPNAFSKKFVENNPLYVKNGEDYYRYIDSN